MILERMREKVTALDVELEAERAAKTQGVHEGETHLQAKGRLEDSERCTRREPLGGEVLLASLMIGKTAKIEHSWTITEEGVSSSVNRRRTLASRAFDLVLVYHG